MNRYFWTMLSLLVLTLSATAETRSATEALAIAEAQWQSVAAPARGGAAISPCEMRLTETRMMKDEQTPALYIFSRDNDGGWVIVSAETGMQPVLAYGENGSMAIDASKPNVAWWMERYAAQAEAIRKNPALARQTIAANTYSDIQPLIGSKWSQDNPYDLYCPSLNGSRCPTGCVATAVGQIMYKHKYPIQGTGSYSYYWETGGKTLSADFGNTTYYWGRMTPTYSSGSSTQAKQAVATLLYHVGVCCDMDYNTDGSGADGENVMNGLVNHFGYSSSWTAWDLKGSFNGYYQYYSKYTQVSETTLLGYMEKELQAGRPMLITGYSYTSSGLGGHAFVCEGMQNNGYIYINWGWGGVSDGYFALTNMNPDEQGTGGTDGAYEYMVTVYARIQPNGYSPEPDWNFASAIAVDSSSVAAGKISLTLSTADHTGLSSDTSSTSLRLSLFCRDAASLAGTWVLDTVSTTATGTGRSSECILYYGGSRYSEQLEDGMFTIRLEDNHYVMYLKSHTLARDIADTLTLSMSAVSAQRADGTPYTLSDDRPTWADFDRLVTYTENHLTRTENGPVPVMVQGVVNRLVYTQAQVASTGLHRIFIQGTKYSIALKDTRFLGGESWTAARYDSVLLGDTIAVWGPIRRYNTNQPIVEYGTLLEIPHRSSPTTKIISEEHTISKARKILRNGQIVILREEEEYTLLGQRK